MMTFPVKSGMSFISNLLLEGKVWLSREETMPMNPILREVSKEVLVGKMLDELDDGNVVP